MERKLFLHILLVLRRKHLITRAERRDLLRRWDAGQITERDLPLRLGAITPTLTPATAEQAVRNRLSKYARRLKAPYSNRFKKNMAQRLARGSTAGISDRTRVRLAISMAETMKADLRLDRLSLPRGRLRRWQRQFTRRLNEDLQAMARLGKGRRLDLNDLRQLRQVQRQQAHFLARFSDEIRIRDLLGRPYSERYLRHRLTMYSGRALGTFYRFDEQDIATGYVLDFTGSDAERTCSPCLDAESAGPYLPGEGPYPGEVCSGAGLCRHERRRRYSPRDYATLRST